MNSKKTTKLLHSLIDNIEALRALSLEEKDSEQKKRLNESLLALERCESILLGAYRDQVFKELEK